MGTFRQLIANEKLTGQQKPEKGMASCANLDEAWRRWTKEIMDDIDRADEAKRRAADSSPAACSTCANLNRKERHDKERRASEA
jgi:hypothetical protein